MRMAQPAIPSVKHKAIPLGFISEAGLHPTSSQWSLINSNASDSCEHWGVWICPVLSNYPLVDHLAVNSVVSQRSLVITFAETLPGSITLLVAKHSKFSFLSRTRVVEMMESGSSTLESAMRNWILKQFLHSKTCFLLFRGSRKARRQDRIARRILAWNNKKRVLRTKRRILKNDSNNRGSNKKVFEEKDFSDEEKNSRSILLSIPEASKRDWD